MRNPVPVGGTWNGATFELRITFDERIASANTIASRLTVDGTPLTWYGNPGVGSPNGRVVSWPTVPVGGEPSAPLRVTHSAGGPPITGVGGGVVLPFANFPLTLV